MSSGQKTFPQDFSSVNTREDISDAVTTPYGNGLTKGRSNLSEQGNADNEDIMLKDTLNGKENRKKLTKKNQTNLEEKSFTLGLVREGSQETSETKLNISELSSLLMTLSETLAQDLTTIGKDCDSSWTGRIKGNSKKLWLPIKTDCVDGDSKSLKMCLDMFRGRKLLSFPSLKLPLNKSSATTLSRSSPCLPHVYTVKEGMQHVEKSDEKSYFKTRKYRILLPKNRTMKKEIVDQLQNDFGAFRWYCNFTLDTVIPAFEEVLKAKDKIAGELEEVKDQYTFISRMEEKIYRAIRKGKAFDEQVQLDLDMEEGRKDVERRYAAARGNVYKKYRFYRMCSGQSLSYKQAKTELGHSMLNGLVKNTKGQLCNVINEDPTHSGLPKPDWIKNSEFKVHNRVPRGAVKKTITDIKSAITNWRNGNIKFFEFKRRTKKNDRQILHFEDKDIPSYIKNLTMVYRHGRKIIKRNPTLTAGSELVHDRLTDKYYMMVPESYDPTPLTHENQVSLDAKTIVFDEGIRAFLSGYVPNTCTVEFGTDATSLLQILTRTDQIRNRISRLINRELISKLWIKIKRLNRRLKNKISDLHWKICRFLSLNFKTVIIPTFPVQEIAKALGFNHDSKRLLYLFSHYAFKQKLQFKARENGFQTFLVGEAYTSQTCGNCHNRHKTKSKTYICPKCHIEVDRDLNAARNILLKFLYELCRSPPALLERSLRRNELD